MGEVAKINITSKNSTNSLSSIVTTAVNMVTDVAVKSINKKISSEIEEWIDDYQTQNTTTNLKQQTIKEAFTTLQNSIAVNAYDAKNGEWATINEKNIQYWTDNPLRFTRHEETGAYLIEQQDENGNWIAMGYTNQNTVLNYLKKIELLQSPESDLNKPPKQEEQKEEVQPKKINIEYVDAKDIPNEFQQEVMNYRIKTTTRPSQTSFEYQKLSETAKKIVDGEIVMKDFTYDYSEVLKNGGEFTIPKGKVLTIPGEIRNLIEGESIKVDIATGKVIDSNGKIHNIENLKNAEFN